MTPTARSIAYLREQGYIVHRVEYWNQFARRRIDVFGFGDLLVAKPDWGTALVQVTTTAHIRHRAAKMQTIPAFWTWLRSGSRVLVHGWAKRGPRGKRKHWQLTVLEYGPETRLERPAPRPPTSGNPK